MLLNRFIKKNDTFCTAMLLTLLFFFLYPRNKEREKKRQRTKNTNFNLSKNYKNVSHGIDFFIFITLTCIFLAFSI